MTDATDITAAVYGDTPVPSGMRTVRVAFSSDTHGVHRSAVPPPDCDLFAQQTNNGTTEKPNNNTVRAHTDTSTRATSR